MNYLRQLKILVFLTVSHGTLQAQDQYFSSVSIDKRLGSHTVKAGETLSSIARRHGVRPKTLIQHNGITDPNSLRIGQTLTIPGKSGTVSKAARKEPRSVAASGGSTLHTIRKGETLSAIARRHGVTVTNLREWNGISDPSKLQVGQKIRLTTGSSRTSQEKTTVVKAESHSTGSTQGARSHVLQKGETLSSISRKHGISVPQLMALNKISDPTRLGIGQKLVLSSISGAVTIPPGQANAQNAETNLNNHPAGPVAPPTPIEAYKSLVSGSPSRRYGQHTVRPGDTLHSISKENNISVEALRAANGLGQSNFIRDNQLLKIPSAHWVASHVTQQPAAESTAPTAPTANAVATHQAPARATQVKPLFEVPPVPDPEPDPQAGSARQTSNYFGFTPTPTAEGTSEYLDYTVGPSVTQRPVAGQPAQAEDLLSIAGSFSTTAEEIRRLNNLVPGEPLQIGRKIIVPAAGLFGNAPH
ncbi:MAG: lysozyme [Verrucomicrobiales bacterium]|jgi:lysozyme